MFSPEVAIEFSNTGAAILLSSMQIPNKLTCWSWFKHCNDDIRKSMHLFFVSFLTICHMIKCSLFLPLSCHYYF